MKQLFHQFDPIIYPRLLWISNNAKLENVKERFDLWSINDEEEINKFRTKHNTIMFKVIEKETNRLGTLLLLKSKKIDISTIAHEAVHIADYIFEEIGAYSQDFVNKNEPYAYLVGWIAKCINDVRIYRK